MPDTDNIRIDRWTSDHVRWPELLAVCADLGQGDLDDKLCDFHLGLYTLCASTPTEVVGFLRFWTQQIGVDEDKPPFFVDGKPAIEAKVVALGVREGWRRRGLGRLLQTSAVEWARELKCYQVRSRSCYDSTANYALKAELGFGIDPARNERPGENTAFFLLPLRAAPELLIGA